MAKSLLFFAGFLCVRDENPRSQALHTSKNFSFLFVPQLCLGKINLTHWISIRQMWSPVIGCSCFSPQSFLYNLIFGIVSFPACFPPGFAFDLAGELGGRSCLKCIDGYLIPHQSLRRGVHALPILLRGVLETNCSSSLTSLAACSCLPVLKVKDNSEKNKQRKCFVGLYFKIIALLRPCNNLYH